MTQTKLFITGTICFGIVICTKAQVKPNTQTQPNSTTQTLNPVPSAYAGGITTNYIRTWDAQKPFTTDTALSSGLRNAKDVKQVSQYIDGLGRDIQTVAKQVTPNGYDMVTADIYDQYSRDIFKYLPYVDTSANGNFKNDPFNKQANFEKAFYNPTNSSSGEKFFYKKTDYEASPLQRVAKTYAPGNSWAGRGVGIGTQYLVNDILDSVCIWDISLSANAVPVYSGYYPTGQLNKIITTDERGNQVITYKDKDGHAILKKEQSTSAPYSGHTGWVCSYYIFDDLGNLRFVIQPLGVNALKSASWTFDNTTWATSTIAKELCFSYEYDTRNRMTIKRVPGGGEIWMVYDTRDRIVMSQDANLRAQSLWLYTSYDSLDRTVLTGIWNNSNNQSYHQNLANNGGNYPNPSSSFTVLTQTYYDDYTWVSTADASLPTSPYTGYNTSVNYFYTASDAVFPYPRALTATNLTRGMVTGIKVHAINTSSDMCTVNFYDDRMRMVQTQSRNYTGGIDTVITQYSFSSQVLRTLVCHGKGGTNAGSIKVLNAMVYDATGRLIRVTQKTGTSPEVIVTRNSYDELGQLAQKDLGETRTSLTDTTYTGNPIDSLSYTYNIRGWLRGINKDYANVANNAVNWFGMELNYDYGFTSSQLNGNVAGIKWRSGGDGQQRAYGFTYDALNRLTKGDFTQNAGGSTWDLSGGIDFSLRSVRYDANGNITQLYQKGISLNATIELDSLSYGYTTNTNKLKYVTDKANDANSLMGDFKEQTNNTSQDYWYDDNGNLTQDNNKGITNIHYNFLNLPDSITVTGKGYIKYIYTATGGKLEKITVDNSVTPSKTTKTHYVGLFVYQNDTLQYVAQPEGRVRPKTPNHIDTMFYDYMEKDYLGNTRVVITDEKQQDVYPVATLEANTNALNTEKAFYDIDDANIVDESTVTNFTSSPQSDYKNHNGSPPYNNNPYADTSAASTKLYKLNGSAGIKRGLGITLKVMAGDVVDVYGRSFWHSTGTNPNNSYLMAANNFINSLAATGAIANAGKGATGAALQQTGSPTTTGVINWINSVPMPGSASIPKAYINWLLLDESFHVVYSGSGFDLVSLTSDSVKFHHKAVSINKSGYLYVYCSNESNYDVYFDNLQLIHTRGPLLETDNYHPFGLIQSGISSTAAMKLEYQLKYNGKELQHSEFSDGSGLNWYDYGARMYDQQIGRWHVIDPSSEKMRRFSVYNYCFDNPIFFQDPDGMDPGQHYISQDAAAHAWGLQYAEASVTGHREYGSGIYTAVDENGNQYWSYNQPSIGDAETGYLKKYNHSIPAGAIMTAFIHSHFGLKDGDMTFSDYVPETGGDVSIQNTLDRQYGRSLDYYVTTADGVLHAKRVGGGAIQQEDDANLSNDMYVSKDLPSGRKAIADRFDKLHKDEFINWDFWRNTDSHDLRPRDKDWNPIGPPQSGSGPKKEPKPNIKPPYNNPFNCYGCYDTPPSWISANKNIEQ